MDLSGNSILLMMEGKSGTQNNEPTKKSTPKSTLPKHISASDVEKMFGGSHTEELPPKDQPLPKTTKKTRTNREDLRSKFSKRLEKWRPTK